MHYTDHNVVVTLQVREVKLTTKPSMKPQISIKYIHHYIIVIIFQDTVCIITHIPVPWLHIWGNGCYGNTPKYLCDENKLTEHHPQTSHISLISNIEWDMMVLLSIFFHILLSLRLL